jgi:mRNA interferase MazF
MVDKIATIPKNKLGHRIGHLGAADVIRLNQAMLIFLGLAG